ncbi:MAG: DUF512 domain-containing protein [Oscillospiraceae bacterium]|nr:DUF512 domain-containing protein [Oscillospiraceae bacterium]
MAVLIKDVSKGSVAEKYGIAAGDTLTKINGEDINDMLDLQFYQTGENLDIVLLTADGAEKTVKISGKDEYEPLGLEFETYLIDKHHHCKNKCLFCFIDQLPKGMRQSLYFKDDDERLSFLFGNYITMTNLTQKEVDRIKKVRISPINISVHTTNPELRVKMMKNPNATNVMERMREFADADIKMNCQIVLCKNVNDGDELRRSIRDLQTLYPAVQSASIVPIGLTRYRDGLEKAESFSGEDCKAVIKLVKEETEQFYRENGTRLVYLSDEFYLNAGMDIPQAEYYEDFPQIENGVGMVRTFIDNFMDDMDYHADAKEDVAVDIATGESFYPVLCTMADMAMEKYGDKVKIYIHKIKNEFFGGNVSVTGLLTGTDLVKQLAGNLKTDRLCLCNDVLSDNADIFLDDMTVPQLEEALGTNAEFYSCDGYDLLSGILKEV